MKYNYLILFTFCFFSFNAIAQEDTEPAASNSRYEITAGYYNLNVRVQYENIDRSANSSGFFAGVLADIRLSSAFHLEPGVIYASADESHMLYLPFLVKYYFSKSDFYLQAGPQASIILNEVGGDIYKFGLDAALGAGYDFNKNFFVSAKYAAQLNNRVNTKQEGVPDDVKGSSGSFMAGVGYRF